MNASDYALHEPMSSRGRLLSVVFALYVIGCVFFGFQWWASRWHETAIQTWRFAGVDETTLLLVIPTCNADHRVSLREEVNRVRVLVKERDDTTDDCLDGVEVRLREPLGGRDVVDSSTGRLVAEERR